MLEKHGEYTPQVVLDAIKEKSAYIAEATQNVPLPEQEAEEEMLDAALEEPEPDAEETEEEQPVPSPEEFSDDEQPAEETPEETSDEEDEEPDYESTKVCPKCGKLLAVTDAFCTECGAKQDVPAGEPAEEPAKADMPLDDDAEFVTGTPPEEILLDDEEEDEECEVYDDEDYVPEDEEDEELSVEEKLHRGIAKNIRKAFSINDSMRYRRELFGNNAVDHTDALDMIEGMKSYEEATEYFYDELGWDPENEVVKEFMAVVKKHYM